MDLGITGQVLVKVLDNDIDNQPNRIREKDESLSNTLRRVKNIPYTVAKEERKPIVVDNYSSEKKNELESEAVGVNPPDWMESVPGREKPIRITEAMMRNISNKKLGYNEVEEVRKETKIVDSIARDDNYDFEKFDFNVEENSNRKPFVEAYGASVEESNIDDEIKDLEKTSRLVLNIHKQAAAVESDINRSNEELKAVGNKLNEADRKYQERQKLTVQYEAKIREALKQQKKLLEQEYSKSSEKIESAERIKEENSAKIVDFQERIREKEDATYALDQQIEKQRKILESLGYSFGDNEKEESLYFGRAA